jgi:NitT/TauT family transport system substrate-binding protein
MKRNLILVIVCGLVLAGCQSAPAASDQRPSIHVAFPSEADLTDIPSLMALDLLEEQGYDIDQSFLAGVDLAVEALSRGDAQFAVGAVAAYWAGIEQGANIVTIAEQTRNTWTLMATNDIGQCSDIEGKRLAITSEGSGSAALTRAFIAQECPGIEYEIVLISGSSNRAAALLAGEVDVTPLELVDAQRIQEEAPDSVRVLVVFADDLPDMIVTGIHANRAFAEANPDVVEDFLSALLTVHAEIAEDPEPLVQKASEVLGEDADVLRPIIDDHLAFDAWSVDGGLTEARVNNSLTFFASTGDLSGSLQSDDVADWSYLQVALER